MPTSSAVNTGDIANASDYNNLRTDVLSTHNHDGTEGNGTLNPNIVLFKDQVANPDAVGELQRNGNDLFYFDGTSSIQVNTAGSSSATPALTLGTSNASGSAITFVATDASIAVFDATNPSTQAHSDSPVVGIAAVAARRDHKHGMPAVGGGLANVVDDLTPQLGGDLDFNGKDASGIGHLGFLATQDPSAGANDLDDYEEGSWTPAITFGGGATGVTYTLQVGRYAKVGSLVMAYGKFTLSSKGSSTGIVNITGLPFTSLNVSSLEGSWSALPNGITYTGETVQWILANQALLRIGQLSEAGVLSSLQDTEFSDTSDIRITVTYRTA